MLGPGSLLGVLNDDARARTWYLGKFGCGPKELHFLLHTTTQI